MLVDKVRLWKGSDVAHNRPQIQWLVEDLLPVGGLAVVYGDGGVKKTYAALDLAVCISEGRDWLGMPTRKGAVLVIDEEGGEEPLGARVHDVQAGHGASGENVYCACMSGFNFTHARDCDELKALITATGAVFVIVDAVQDCMAGCSENDASDVGAFLHGLRMIATEKKAATWLIHHANKAGEFRGSTVFRGGPDLLLLQESDQGSSSIVFTVKKGRYSGGATTFGAVAHFEHERFYLSPVAVPTKATTGQQIDAVICEVVTHSPNIRKGVLMEALRARQDLPCSGETYLSGRIDLLTNKGRLLAKKHGTSVLYSVGDGFDLAMGV